MKNKTIVLYEKLSRLDYSQIEYKLGTMGYSKPKIKKMKDACLQFISICSTQKGSFGPSFLVDEVWHQLILSTKFYVKLCKVCGKFLHHNGNDGTKKVFDLNKRAYWNSIQAVKDTFGEIDADIWGVEPIPHMGVNQ